MKITAPREQLSIIKSHLGLSITNLAIVLHVQKSTIYQWLSGTVPEQANIQRLNDLYEIALAWRDLCKHGLESYLQYPIPGGHTLLKLLNQNFLQKRKIINMMPSIADKAESDIKNKSNRSISNRLAKGGYQKLSADEQLDSLRGAGLLAPSIGE